jgi:hypothetical protein
LDADSAAAKETGIVMFTGIGLIAFGCIFGAASFGLFLGHCLTDEATRKAVQKLMTVIGI